LEDLDAEVEINSVWEIIGENIKVSAEERAAYSELKMDKQWTLIIIRSKETSQIAVFTGYVDNVNNVKREASRHFRNKKTKSMSLQRTKTSETCIEE
jgi:hypothetical protein